MRIQAGFFSLTVLFLITSLFSATAMFPVVKKEINSPKLGVLPAKTTIVPTKTPSPTPTTTYTYIPPTQTPTPTPLPTQQPTNNPSNSSSDKDNTPPQTYIISGPGTTSSTQDTTPPQTHIFFPQNNGEMPYKTDGKYCAVANAPTDNITNGMDIETQFAFDDASWSDYGKVRAYMCTDHLSKGQHTLKYRSKDQAGNVESEQTLKFTVTFEE